VSTVEDVREMNPVPVLGRDCFYCLGDRPDVHGTLPDMVVLYISEGATSFAEAFREFEEYESEAGERMRLNVILRVTSAGYYDSIK
jgi:hypothetical protein